MPVDPNSPQADLLDPGIINVGAATPPLAMTDGFLRDANRLVVTVDEAAASAPTSVQAGFLRDSTGALVSTTNAGGMARGFIRTATGSLVVVP